MSTVGARYSVRHPYVAASRRPSMMSIVRCPAASVCFVRGAVHPRALSPAEVANLVQQSPMLVTSLQSGDPEPTPDWFLDELTAARRRSTGADHAPQV
jgi:hypothetical protein